MALATVGGEFQVNTETASGQNSPAITSLAGGGFVVTWYDYSGLLGDNSQSSVKAQIFSANGAKVGGEILVNTNTNGTQFIPTVAGLSDGGFVVTWTDDSHTLGDASGNGIKAQVFTATGAKAGGEFLVNTTTALDQQVSAVTAAPGGGFIVSWADYSFESYPGAYPTSVIKAQMYGAGDLRISSDGGGDTASVLAPENDTAVTKVTASYVPIGATVTYGISGGADAALFAIDAQTGALTFKHAPNFEIPGDAGANGIYDVIVSATAGTVTDTQQIAVTVTDVKEPPVPISKLGGEGLVNTATAADQLEAAVARLANGGFVVTWQDFSGTLGDSDPTSIKAQIYGADGAKVGPEFLVNTTTASSQIQPVVTGLKDGGFVVTWTDFSGTGLDANGSGIKAQVYDADGAKVGGEFLVNTVTQGEQSNQEITALANGGFVVTWMDFSTWPSIIKAQIFDAAGTKIGSEFLANTDTTDQHRYPVTAGLADGGFVISWYQQSYSSAGSASHIEVQRFAADGTPAGAAIQIVPAENHGVSEQRIAALAGGGFVVTWTNGDYAATSNYTELSGQIFAADGTKLGGEFLINSELAGDQWTPRVTGLPNGGFVVAWYDNGADLNGPGDSNIKAQVFDASGHKQGDEFTVNTQTADVQYDPMIAGFGNGGFVVTWTDSDPAGDGSGWSVKAQIYSGGSANSAPVIDSGNGGASAAVMIVENTKAITTVHATDPDAGTTLTYSVSGTDAALFDIDSSTGALSFKTAPNYEAPADSGANNVYDVVVTASDGTDADTQAIAITIVNDDETPRTGQFQVPTSVQPGSGKSGGAITKLASGYFVVTWDASFTDGDGSDSGIKAQIFGPAGNKIGSEFLVNTSTLGIQNQPSVGALANGGFVVSWTDRNGDADGWGVKAQVFGPLGAKVGSEFLVNTQIVSHQLDSKVTGLSNGGFVITWNDVSGLGDGSGTSIMAQIYSANGVKVGGEFVASTTTFGDQYYPVITSLEGGGFAIAWSDASGQGGDNNGYSVKANIFDAAGVKVASEILANTQTANQQYMSTITSLSGGGFVVSWIDYSGIGGDASNAGIKAQIFSANGTKVGGEFLVNTQTALDQVNPAVSSLAGGGFVVAWQTNDQGASDGEGAAIKAQIFSAAGAKIGTEFLVNVKGAGNQTLPKVIGLDNGDFVITWQDDRLSSIEARIFSAPHAPVITSNGGGDTAAISIAENTTAVTTVLATDQDAGTTLTYSVSGTDASKFNIDAATGVLTFKTAPNFEAPGDAGGNNVYDVVVTASDGVITDTQTLAITVGNVNDAPVISSNGAGASASVSIAENSTAVTTVIAGDDDGNKVTYAITGGADKAKFEIDAQTGALVFVGAPNFEAAADTGANNVYDVVVTASDGTLTDTQAIAVTVTNVNEAPVITSDGGSPAGTVSISENGKAVTTVRASDPDAGTALTYSITGGADASKFQIDASTGALAFINKPNFEAPADAGADNVYNVTVTASDGTLTDSQQLEVTVANVNEPPVITSNGGGDLASISVAENGTGVTVVAATDPESESVTYAIAGGTDRLKFNIDQATGTLSFKAAPNFESPSDSNGDNVYSVLVSATDSANNSSFQLLSITVTNVNEAPVITSNGGDVAASISISENTTAVTKVTATDPDAGATQTYSISGGADAAKFQIDAATGALSFKAVPNFEAPTDAGGDNVYNVTVSVSDGSLTDTQDIAVTVTDVAEGPAFTSLGKLGAETLVNTNTSGRQYTPSLAGLEGGGFVAVWTDLDSKTLGDTNAGAIKAQLYAADGTAVGSEFLINTFTPGNQIDATVTALKGGGFAVTWSGPSNDGFDILGQVFNASGGKVGSEFTVNPATPPYSSQYAPTITGLSGGGFVVTWWDADSGTGGDSVDSIKAQIYAADGSKVGSEFRVNTVTAGSQFEPSIASLSNGGFVVTWNSDEGTSGPTHDLAIKAQVYSATGVKVGGEFLVNTANGGTQQKAEVTGLPDGHFVVVWEDESGVGGDSSRSGIKAQLFEADGTKIGGEILVNTFTPDYQRLPKVAALANGDFVVTWNTANDGNGTSVSAQVFHADGSKFGTEFTANTSTTFTQQNPSVTGLANGTFAVAWQDDSASQLDYARSFDIRLQLFGNNSAPAITSDGGAATASLTVNENSTAVTTVQATDAETQGAVRYSISGGADASKFDINSSTGVLTFKTAPNFEAATDNGTNNVYDVKVKASDGSLFTEQTIAVTVANVNEAPAITSNGGSPAGSVQVAENGTSVTTVQASDPDAGTTLVYSITGGADRSLFSINSSTGALSFKNAPNFEAPGDNGGNNVYDVTVTVSDGAITDSQNLAVTVTDANDAPVITSSGGAGTATASVNENGTLVVDVNATDEDPNTTLVYSISGGLDAGKFDINGTTGVLTFKTAPNFEAPTDAGANNVYDVIVTASDGTLFDTQAIAVTVTNVNEAPAITNNGGSPNGAVSIGENGTSVTTVQASDPDAGTTLVYSISGGADAGKFDIDSATGALTFKSAPNFEAPTDAGGNNVYDVIVKASDGTLTDTQALAVTVTNANEAPVITSNGGGNAASLIVDEKVATIATVVAGDPDAGSSLTYSLGGADAALFNIDAATGQLTFKARPNVETPGDTGGDNIYDVIVKASDAGGLSDTQALSIEVRRFIYGTALADSGTKATTGTVANDYMFGLAGNDVITGLDGNDTIDGGLGNDRMAGGKGNDTYVVDSTADVVTELANEGTDTVLASASSHTLGANVENLTFTNAVKHKGVGNDLANRLTGHDEADSLAGKGGNDTLLGLGGNDTLFGDAGNDVLDGGTGADKMVGGEGDDVYFVDNAGDRVVEDFRKGSDTVNASVTFTISSQVETLNLTGSDAINGTGGSNANTLRGNTAANVLNGCAGDDVLSGGLGNDTLIGGSGADKFLFDSAPGTLNSDVVRDFLRSDGDKLVFSKAVFAELGAPGALTSDAFFASATATAAHDADDRIVYNTATGQLWYDADGLGGQAAVQIATIGTTTHPGLTFADFLVVA